MQGDVIRIAIHKADTAPVRAHLNRVAGEQRTTPPMKNTRPREMSAAPHQAQPTEQRLSFSAPKYDCVCGPHDPLLILLVQIDGNSPEALAPVPHGRVVVRVRDGNGCETTSAVDEFGQLVIQ